MKIKKILIVVLGLFSIGLISQKANAAGVPKGYENANITEVGSSVNIIANGLNGSKTTIFTDDYRFKLEEKALLNCKIINRSTETYVASTNENTINKNISSTISSGLGGTGVIDGVDISASSSVINKESLTSNSVSSSAHVYYGNYNCKYELIINNDDLSPEVLKNNNGYSKTFYNSLSTLSENNDYDSYVDFFEKFGTHILSDALMGGKLEMTAIYCSSSYSYSKKQIQELKSNFETAVNNFKVNNSMNSSVSSTYNISEMTDYYMIKANSTGGNSTYLIDFELNKNNKTATSNYKEWASTLTDYSRSGVIGVGGNGLVPVWDILPEEYSHLKENMKSMFKKYTNNTYKYTDDIYNSLDTGEVPKQLVRDSQVKITDSGRVNQQKDQINSNYIDGLLPSERYKNAGFKKCKITIDLMYKIKDLGDQHFYVYKCEPNSNNLESGVLGHWKNSRNKKSWFNKHIELTVNIDDILNDKMMIVYSASGKLNDDWYNKMVYVSFKFTR